MKPFFYSVIAAGAALSAGGAMVLSSGFEPPAWLLRLEVAACGVVALTLGFMAAVPSVGPWLRLRPVRGASMVVLGVGAVYVPVQFIASAALIGFGVRLVWQSACELDVKPEGKPGVPELRRAGAIRKGEP